MLKCKFQIEILIYNGSEIIIIFFFSFFICHQINLQFAPPPPQKKEAFEHV
jgi:hypothetical protein